MQRGYGREVGMQRFRKECFFFFLFSQDEVWEWM